MAAKRRGILGIVEWSGTVELLRDTISEASECWTREIAKIISLYITLQAAESTINPYLSESFLTPSESLTCRVLTRVGSIKMSAQRPLSCKSSSSPFRWLTRTRPPAVPRSTLSSWQRGKPRALAVLYDIALDQIVVA